MGKEYILQFDNGGGLRMSLGYNYIHNYEDMTQAAEDLKSYLNGSDPDDWEGNDLDETGPIVINDEWERSGGTRTYTDLAFTETENSWRNIEAFSNAWNK